MAVVRGILFDKDGTLVYFDRFWIPFTRDLIRLALQRINQEEEGLFLYLLEEMGIHPQKGTLIPGGAVAEETTEALFSLLGSRLKKKGLISGQAVQELIQYLYTLLTPLTQKNQEHIVPVTDLHQLLGALQNQGLFLGIATHDSRSSTEYFLETMNIRHYFHYIGCAQEGIPSKPHPYLLEAFQSTCHLKSQEVAVVGDTLGDLQMARQGQALAVGVLTGITDRKTLQGEAHLILDSVAHLYHPQQGLCLPSPLHSEEGERETE